VDGLILAVEGCDYVNEVVCKPDNVLEFFEFPALFGDISRTIFLIALAALIVMGLLFFTYRKPRLVPTKFQAGVESVVGFVKDEIAVGIIGPEGIKYAPYLLSIFLFILVGNLFEVTPLINFPITSRMAIPAFLALLTETYGRFLDAWHEIVPVQPRIGTATVYDIVGPVCETGDFLGRERSLALVEGELLAVMSAGAYAMSMSSNYNTRPRAAEIMVDGSAVHLIRARERVEDLYAGEVLLT